MVGRVGIKRPLEPVLGSNLSPLPCLPKDSNPGLSDVVLWDATSAFAVNTFGTQGVSLFWGAHVWLALKRTQKTPTHLEVHAFGDNPTISEQVRWPQGSPQNAKMTSMFGNVWDGVSLRDMPNNSLLGGDGPFDALKTSAEHSQPVNITPKQESHFALAFPARAKYQSKKHVGPRDLLKLLDSPLFQINRTVCWPNRTVCGPRLGWPPAQRSSSLVGQQVSKQRATCYGAGSSKKIVSVRAGQCHFPKSPTGSWSQL